MHFLKKGEADRAQPLQAPRATVTVRVEGRSGHHILHIEPSEFSVLKVGAMLVPLPKRVQVLDPDGKTVKPSPGRSFFVTTETFDPYHALTELEAL